MDFLSVSTELLQNRREPNLSNSQEVQLSFQLSYLSCIHPLQDLPKMYIEVSKVLLLQGEQYQSF